MSISLLNIYLIFVRVLNKNRLIIKIIVEWLDRWK